LIIQKSNLYKNFLLFLVLHETLKTYQKLFLCGIHLYTFDYWFVIVFSSNNYSYLVKVIIVLGFLQLDFSFFMLCSILIVGSKVLIFWVTLFNYN
jgi:hypothetical protein